jgi:hypothetical protein
MQHQPGLADTGFISRVYGLEEGEQRLAQLRGTRVARRPADPHAFFEEHFQVEAACEFLQLPQARDVLAQQLRLEHAFHTRRPALELFDEPHAAIV